MNLSDLKEGSSFIDSYTVEGVISVKKLSIAEADSLSAGSAVSFIDGEVVFFPSQEQIEELSLVVELPWIDVSKEGKKTVRKSQRTGLPITSPVIFVAVGSDNFKEAELKPLYLRAAKRTESCAMDETGRNKYEEDHYPGLGKEARKGLSTLLGRNATIKKKESRFVAKFQPKADEAPFEEKLIVEFKFNN